MVAALAGGWWGCALTFPCSADDECTREGVAGVCQASGYCSFPDTRCESDQRYGELAPGALAGTCVPVDEGSSTLATDGPPGGTATSSATTVDPSAESGVVDSGSSDGDGSTGGPPPCCHAGCDGSCATPCPTELLGGPAVDQEAIGVAVVGEWVVWSTGYGRSLQIASMDASIDEVLVNVTGNSFVTKIAADDTHVYFVDYGGPTVKRASVPEGAVDLVTEVEGGMAAFGGIAVGSEHVYFAMRSTGGVWRASKALTDQDGAQLVADAESPFDVVLDATHVYWIDGGVQEVRRLALAEIGSGAPGTTVLDGGDLTTLVVDQDSLFVGDGSAIVRADKAGTNEGITTLATGQGMVWDIAVDDVHVYWTAADGSTVGRVAKDGTEGEELLADTPTPWGLDLSCDGVFWAENGSQTLRHRLK